MAISTALAEATLQYGENSTQVQELNDALMQNQEAQTSALSSLQSLTAEMIYQQAAAGLDTQASLDLARSMIHAPAADPQTGLSEAAPGADASGIGAYLANAEQQLRDE